MRLDQHRMGVLSGLAVVDDTTVAEQIRKACEAYYTHRLDDPDLRAKIDAAMGRFRLSLSNLLPIETPDAPVDLPAPEPPARELSTEKTVTLRLGLDVIDFLSALALLDDHTLADEIRAAVDLWNGQRLADPTLEDEIEQHQREREELIEVLRSAAGH